MNTRYLTSVSAFKETQDESGITSDAFYLNILKRSSRAIEHYCKRVLRARSVTEYLDGNGMQSINFNEWPVIGETSDVDLYLASDLNRDFDSDEKFEDDDWMLVNSESLAILLSDSSLGNIFTKGHRNVKAVYTAGYDEFNVIENVNDTIDFTEGDSALAATLTADTYTADELATEIQLELEAAGEGSYTVLFNPQTSKFTLTKSAGTFEILWSTGTNASQNAADLLGFNDSADDTGALTYTADNSRTGVPEDLEQACLYLMTSIYENSGEGEDRFGKVSIETRANSGGTTTYKTGKLPEDVVGLLEPYRRINI